MRGVISKFIMGTDFEKRRARSAGEFPWDTCYQWVKDAGPFIRNVNFNVITPLRAYEPMVSVARRNQLQWDYPIHGLFSVQVLPGPGANVRTVWFPPTYPPAPVPAGLMLPPAAVAGMPYPYYPANSSAFDGQCQRANIEARRLRQSYLPAVQPPGAMGFTGFTLLDLRSIAKSFSEPSIYAIQY